jgi:tetratricopeptide (TPR) repeat protein
MKRFAIFAVLSVLALCFLGNAAAEGGDYDSLSEQVNKYIDAGNDVEAIPLLKRMHELKPEELFPVEYLGILYADMPEDRPEFANALPWLLEAERRYSGDRSVYYSLACVYSIKGDLEGAVRSMNKAVFLGHSDFEQMSNDENLANFRTTAWWKGIEGRFSDIAEQFALFYGYISTQGEKSLEENITFYASLVSALERLAPHIPALKRYPLWYLAGSLNNDNNYSESANTYSELLEITENILGKEHPSNVFVLNNLGKLYHDMGVSAYNAGNYSLAIDSLTKLVAITEKALGKEHLSYATSLNNLGFLYKDTGDYGRRSPVFWKP